MLACMGLLGLGGGSLTTSASALLSDINPARRAVILTLTKSSYGIGGFLTPMIGATLLAGNTIALCYVISAFACALVAVIAFVAFPAASMRSFNLSLARPLLGKPLLYLLSLAMFFYVACEVGMFNWLPKYLIARGLAETVALSVVSFRIRLGLIGWQAGIRSRTSTCVGHVVAVISAIAMAAARPSLWASTEPLRRRSLRLSPASRWLRYFRVL